MLCEHIRQQVGHPLLDRVWEAVDKRTNAEDGGVSLAYGLAVIG